MWISSPCQQKPFENFTAFFELARIYELVGTVAIAAAWAENHAGGIPVNSADPHVSSTVGAVYDWLLPRYAGYFPAQVSNNSLLARGLTGLGAKVRILDSGRLKTFLRKSPCQVTLEVLLDLAFSLVRQPADNAL